MPSWRIPTRPGWKRSILWPSALTPEIVFKSKISSPAPLVPGSLPIHRIRIEYLLQLHDPEREVIRYTFRIDSAGRGRPLRVGFVRPCAPKYLPNCALHENITYLSTPSANITIN